ncbi:MAG: LysM peptidoglycan-binding domain-containing protein [Bacteroidia bacterium]
MKRISILILAACLTVEIGVAQAMTLSYGPMVGASASGGDEGVHTVQSGQTLYSIARLYGTTTEELQRLNGMESTALLVGQKIKVPVSANQKEKEAVSDDSKAGERTMPDENTEKIMVPRSILEKVLPGETITTFAKRVGTTVDFIKEKNGVSSVKAGEKMIVKEEMVAVPGEKKKPAPKKAADTEARDLGDLDAMLSAVDDDTETKLAIDAEAVEEVSSTETEEERVAPATEEIQEKATVEFVNPSMVLGNTIETATFVQKDAKLKERYYIFHKTLPKGTKVKIHIPDNAGYVMAEVVGKLEAESTSGIALSPACVRIVGGTSLRKVTFSY